MPAGQIASGDVLRVSSMVLKHLIGSFESTVGMEEGTIQMNMREHCIASLHFLGFHNRFQAKNLIINCLAILGFNLG